MKNDFYTNVFFSNIIFIDNLVENVCDELTLAHSSISVSEEYYIIPADLYRIKILYKTENNNLIS